MSGSEWLNKFNRPKADSPELRQNLIESNIEKIETAYMKGIAGGMKTPLVFVFNLNDPDARTLHKQLNGVTDEYIKQVRSEINAQGMIPSGYGVMEQKGAIELLTKWQTALHQIDKRNAENSSVVQILNDLDVSEFGQFWAVAISFGKGTRNLDIPKTAAS